MNTVRLQRLLLCGVLAFTGVACGDDDGDGGGTDAGPRDSGGETPDSGEPGDDDGGPGEDGGMPVELPEYCPTIPDPGAAPSCPPLASRPVVDVGTAGGAAVEQSGDLSWTCANTYRLRRTLYMMSGTLNIQAGTHVIGDNEAAIVITQNARINANGHPMAPIVFTSSRSEGSRAAGDWGGIVLLGDAPINTGAQTVDGVDLPSGVNAIEGLPATDNRGRYGGSDPAHDCGTLRYARVEFAGYLFGMNNELNSLTMAGCGSATTIEFVQAHFGLDDAFEMFGGSVNLRHVIATAYDDDGLDWDLGYVGNIQYAVVDRLGIITVGSRDPNGIEADNHPNAFDNTPRSNPNVFNLTMIGEPDLASGVGAVLRRGTYGTIRNALVQNYPLGVNVRDTASISQAGMMLSIQNSIFFQNGAAGQQFAYGTGDARTYETAFSMAAAMNRLDVDPGLGDVSDTAPNWVPPMTSPVLTGAATPPSGGFFQSNATFVGAFGPGCPDWSRPWAAYPED